MRNTLRLGIAAAFVLSLTPSAFGAQRTFVASYGLDTNPCALTAPCRSFGAAMALTDSGGELIVLDSAGYGTFSANQSVSVIAPAGIYAGISVFVGSGIVVDGPGIHVVLRGLNINGLGGTTGILMTLNTQSLHVRDVTISNMEGDGLRSQTDGELFVSNTESRRNGLAGISIFRGTAMLEQVRLLDNATSGLRVAPTSSSDVRVRLTDSSTDKNGLDGVFVDLGPSETAHVTVDGSRSSRNASDGFRIESDGASGTLIVSRSLAAENFANGVSVWGSGAVGVLSGNTIARNLVGFQPGSGAVLISLQNNTVEKNSVDTQGTITSSTTK